jgi:hypothetical protein
MKYKERKRDFLHPPSLYTTGTGFLSWGSSGLGVALTTHLHLE